MSRYVDDHCALASFEPGESVLLAHDGSECTLIEVRGMNSIVSTDEATTAFVDRIAAELRQTMQRPGHTVSISYEISSNSEVEVGRLHAAMRVAAKQKSLDVDALIEESHRLTLAGTSYIKVLVAVWTLPAAGNKAEIKKARKQARVLRGEMPPAVLAQNPHLRLDPLAGTHASLVSRVLDALHSARVQARVLEPVGRARHDLREIRRALLFHETPEDWAPRAHGERTYPGVKPKIDRDASEFFAPRLNTQMMTSGVSADKSLRSMQMGGRRYAMAMVDLFPRMVYPFRDLAEALRNGPERNMPFRICFHIESGSYNPGLRHVALGFASIMRSPSSKNAFLASQAIVALTKRDTGDAFVKTRVTSCTWSEPHEPEETLERRRAYLIRAMTSWGDAVISDTPSNPVAALCETVPGLTVGGHIAKETFVPISEVARMMPFHYSAPVFERGTTLFTTLDGQLAPHEAFSTLQNFWLTLCYATPGSGKSVLMNRLNIEFCAYYPGRKLPFLMVIDLGVSSSGFIEVVKAGLPPPMQYIAQYSRLTNTREKAVNPFDLGLGRRYPLDREREFINRFLLRMFTEAGSTDVGELRQLVARLVKRLYQNSSDLEVGNASVNAWEPGIDSRVDDACIRHGIGLNTGKTKWFSLVDELMRRKDVVTAIRAQRHAMPRLKDCARILAEKSVADDFQPALIQYVRNALSDAIERYPMFSNPTQLDLGETRIAAIDLNDVADMSETVEAKRNNSLMFMISRHIFLQKIGGHEEEIRNMEFPPQHRAMYEEYWRDRYQDMQETVKRLCMDEYHVTGGDEIIAGMVKADVRTGRKWGLEIILLSQFLEDFRALKSMASTVMILNAETKELRDQAREILEFNDAVEHALKRHIHGPRPGKGANVLMRYKLNEDERWIVVRNVIGPTMLWALNTRIQDRALRDELYKRMSVSEALRLLAARYETGTAIDHWNKLLTQADDDTSIAKLLADDVISEYIRGGSRNDAARRLDWRKEASGQDLEPNLETMEGQ